MIIHTSVPFTRESVQIINEGQKWNAEFQKTPQPLSLQPDHPKEEKRRTRYYINIKSIQYRETRSVLTSPFQGREDLH